MKIEITRNDIVSTIIIVDAPDEETAKEMAERGEYDELFEKSDRFADGMEFTVYNLDKKPND